MKPGNTFISTIIIFLLCIGVPLYFVSGGISFPMDSSQVLYGIGKFCGLCAFIIFSLQYLWTARFHSFEKFIPYDRRVAIHRTLGFSGFLILVLHPVLILSSYNLLGSKLYISAPILLGFTALLILLLIVGSTFLGRIWRVQFETWKTIHYITFTVLTIAFIHSLGIGSDLYDINRTLWIVLWGLHATVMIIKIIKKIINWNNRYSVKQVIKESAGTTTLVMDKPNRTWEPGQFGFISLKNGKTWEGWHPFSITSNTNDQDFSMTIKSLGDFSDSIGNKTKVGDPVKINPGFGGFTIRRHKDKKYTMIAGGVGVTPIYSLIKSLNKLENPPQIRLLYTVHHESEILFREDFEEIFKKRPNWNITFIVTSQPDWTGVSGRLTPDKCYDLCEKNLSGTFFICGPAPMVHSIEKFLQKNGVPKRRIVIEYFVFLP